MANVSQNLGPVSAYAIAKKHGYQGTEQEWAQLQADSGENARKAEEAWANVEPAARDAVAAAKQTAADAKQTVADAAQTAKDAEQTTRDAEQATSAAERASALAEGLDSILGQQVISDQIFDYTTATPIDASIGTSAMAPQPAGSAYSVAIPCDPDTTYTVSLREGGYSRFTVADAAVAPVQTDSPITRWTDAIDHPIVENGRHYITGKTGPTAKSLVVYYYNRNYDEVPESQIRKDLMVTKGNRRLPYTPYVPGYYIRPESVRGLPDIQSTVDEIAKTSALPAQVFNYAISKTYGAAIGRIGNGFSLIAQPGVLSTSVPCKPDTMYTVSLKEGGFSRFSLGTMDLDLVQTGKPVDRWTDAIDHPIVENGRHYITGRTAANAKNLVIYYYNQSADKVPESEIRQDLMVTEGPDRLPFTPYTVTTKIREEALPDDLMRKTDFDPVTSRSMTFGIAFDNAQEASSCTRIGSAAGLHANYMIGDSFAFGTPNDFDRAFPWCEIRRCNITDDRRVIYDGDPDFNPDGPADVFVEIPKFYSFREVIGTRERILISGEKKSGFQCEPAFLTADGRELDYIYVGAYHTSTGARSLPGKFPQTQTRMPDFYQEAGTRQFGVYDVFTLMAIQKLVTIEYADRNLSQFFNGIGSLPYYKSTQVEQSAKQTHTIQVKGNDQLKFYRPGQWITIARGQKLSDKQIEALTEPVKGSDRSYHMSLTIKGAPVDVEAGEDVYCTAQQEGTTDSIPYHTGRFADNEQSEFKYRWMVNLWGNVWHHCFGIRVKDLNFYYLNSPDQYLGELDSWHKVAYKAPEQNSYPSSTTAVSWIKRMGFERQNRLMGLPIELEAKPIHYGDKFYSVGDTDADGHPVAPGTEFVCCVGGGWDHLDRNGPYAMRFWRDRASGADSWLYGSRLVLRSDI